MLPLDPLQAAVTGVTRPGTGPATASLILQIQRSQDKARGRAATPSIRGRAATPATEARGRAATPTQEEAGTAATSLAVPAAQQQPRSSSFSVRDTPAVSASLLGVPAPAPATSISAAVSDEQIYRRARVETRKPRTGLSPVASVLKLFKKGK